MKKDKRGTSHRHSVPTFFLFFPLKKNGYIYLIIQLPQREELGVWYFFAQRKCGKKKSRTANRRRRHGALCLLYDTKSNTHLGKGTRLRLPMSIWRGMFSNSTASLSPRLVSPLRHEAPFLISSPCFDFLFFILFCLKHRKSLEKCSHLRPDVCHLGDLRFAYGKC